MSSVAHTLLLNIYLEYIFGAVVVNLAKEGETVETRSEHVQQNRDKGGIAYFVRKTNLLDAIPFVHPLLSFFTLFLRLCFSLMEIATTLVLPNTTKHGFFVKLPQSRKGSTLKPFMTYAFLFLELIFKVSDLVYSLFFVDACVLLYMVLSLSDVAEARFKGL